MNEDRPPGWFARNWMWFVPASVVLLLGLMGCCLGGFVLAVIGVGNSAQTVFQDVAKISQTKMNVEYLSRSVELYQATVGEYPSTDQGLAALYEAPEDLAPGQQWSGPYVGDATPPLDAWGNPLQYRFPSEHGGAFDIWSWGPDGSDNSDDDLGNWDSPASQP